MLGQGKRPNEGNMVEGGDQLAPVPPSTAFQMPDCVATKSTVWLGKGGLIRSINTEPIVPKAGKGKSVHVLPESALL